MREYVYIGVIVLLLGFVKWYSDRQYQAGIDHATSSYQAKIIEQERRLQDVSQDKQKAINAITTLWLSKPPTVEIQREEIIKYVTDDTQCNLTRGAVGLYNDTVDPDHLQADYHPTIVDDTAIDASTITQRTTVERLIDNTSMTIACGQQLTTLQEVVRKLECVNF